MLTVGFGTEHSECEISDAAHTARVLGLEHHSVTLDPDQMWDEFNRHDRKPRRANGHHLNHGHVVPREAGQITGDSRPHRTRHGRAMGWVSTVSAGTVAPTLAKSNMGDAQASPLIAQIV